MSKLDGGWGWGGDKSILQFVHVQAGEHVKEKTLLWIRMGEGRGWGSWASRSPWYGRRKGETKPCLRSDSLQHDRARLKGELLKGELGEVWRLPRMWGDSAPPPMFIFPEFRLPPPPPPRLSNWSISEEDVYLFCYAFVFSVRATSYGNKSSCSLTLLRWKLWPENMGNYVSFLWPPNQIGTNWVASMSRNFTLTVQVATNPNTGPPPRLASFHRLVPRLPHIFSLCTGFLWEQVREFFGL